MFKNICKCIFPSTPVGGLNEIGIILIILVRYFLYVVKHKAKVVDVYDGDTIKIVINFSGSFHKFNCRLADIDTPELQQNINEKLYAHFVKKKVSYHLLNEIVTIQCGKFDKYGRLLIWIFTDMPNCNAKTFNQYIINQNWGIKYDGKTKKLWSIYLEENSHLMKRPGVIP